MAAHAIVAQALTKVYQGNVRAVDGIDLVVPQGQIFGLLGPNGAGKTTTAGLFTTRIRVTSGTALVGGIGVGDDPAAVRRVIGVVPQGNTLDRGLTVWENLYFHARYFGFPRREAAAAAWEMLDLARLRDRAESGVLTLSGGMARRLMLVRAVMHRPAVLFLDEPTAGLDPQSRFALWDLVEKVHAEGRTVFLTTHYIEEAERLCERVAVIDHGRVIAEGSPDELKATVSSGAAVTVTVEGDALGFRAAVAAAVPVLSEVVVVDDNRLRFHVAAPDGVLRHLTGLARDSAVEITGFSIEEPTLESVFVTLTGRELRE